MTHKFTIASMTGDAEVTASATRAPHPPHRECVELTLAENPQRRGTATLAVCLQMDDAMRLAEVLLSIARHRPSRD